MQLSNFMKNLKSFVLSLVVGVMLLAPSFAHAQLGQDGFQKAGKEAYGGTPATDLETITGKIIFGFLGLLGIAFVVLMIYAGYQWMTAQGNEEKVTTAKKLIVQATIGLIIILAAYAITEFVVTNVQDATS